MTLNEIIPWIDDINTVVKREAEARERERKRVDK